MTIIPPESIVVFWNTIMFCLALLVVLGPVLLFTLWFIDKKIVSPEYEKIKGDERG